MPTHKTEPSPQLSAQFWDEDDIANAKALKGPILIIGVSGFIGANLFYHLSSIRDDVYGCSRLPHGRWRLQAAAKEKLLPVDITNKEKVDLLIKRLSPRTVFNLSAYGAYARQQDVKKVHETNYMGVLNVLESLRENGCDAFVHAGSSSEYGENCSAPLEDAPLIPNSHYSVSKVGANFLIGYYGSKFGVQCCNVRLYSIFGPWEERDRLIPAVVSRGLEGQFPPLVNPKISRDFVYIDDCTRAMVKAALIVCVKNPGESVNIASGVKTTIRNVAETSQELFNIQEDCQFGNFQNRNWDLPQWFGNPAKAKELMDWESHVTFADGLKATAQWEQAAGELLQFAKSGKGPKKISAIIACYRDNQAIPIMHQRLTKVFNDLDVDYEIIFVNDNSPANDKKVIEEISSHDTHVIGISHSRNFGSQSAFLSGMGISTGDAVVLLDGDLQDPPEVIPKFYKKWLEGYSVVYGERVKREAPMYMQIAYKLFYRTFKALSDVSIPVDAGDFSLIDRKVVSEMLRLNEKDVFLRGLRAWVGFKQTGVPYIRPERLFGVSTNSFFKNIWWAKKAIFSFSFKPLHYIQAFGIGMFGVSILLGLYYLISYMIAPPKAEGVTTIIMLLLMLGSAQLISLSVIGDYVGKILEESKNRPHYIRESLIYCGKTYSDETKMSELIEALTKEN